MSIKSFNLIYHGHSVVPVFMLILTVWLVSSCSNDFLDMPFPSVQQQGDSLFIMSNADNFTQEINMHHSGTASWKLFQYPRWLEVTPAEGTARPGAPVNLQFRINEQEMNFSLGLFALPLVFEVEDVGLVQHTVVLWNVGHPDMSQTPQVVEADYTLEGYYEITNSGYGILLWEVVSRPEWLTLEMTEGMLHEQGYSRWHYSIDPSGLEPGDYSGKVEIRNNASGSPFFIEFKFTIEEKRYYGDFLTGTFMDAVYLKTVNQLVVMTKNPNNLLFFHAGSPHADTLRLNGVPTCMALSEDENILAVGFSNTEISTWAASSRDQLGTYPAGQVPVQVVFGSGNRLFYAGKADYGCTVNGLDMQSGEIYTSQEEIYGLSTLKKVPGKELLIGTRNGFSPDNLFLFDTSAGLVTDALNEYWVSMNGCWVSENGERIFTGTGKIYQVPEYVPGLEMSMTPPSVTGELDISSGRRVKHIVHREASQRIYMATDEGWYGNAPVIHMLDDQSLVEQKSLELTSHPPYGFPQGNTWWSGILNIFPSATGNEIWVIREYPPMEYGNPDTWSVERLPWQD